MPTSVKRKRKKEREFEVAAKGTSTINSFFPDRVSIPIASQIQERIKDHENQVPSGNISVANQATSGNSSVANQDSSGSSSVANQDSSGSSSVANQVSSENSSAANQIPEPIIDDHEKEVTSEEEHERKKRKKESKHKVSKASILQLNFPWLKIVSENDGKDCVLYCTLCQKHKSIGGKGKGTWVTVGYRCLRKDKVKEHLLSEQHKDAMCQEVEFQKREVRDIQLKSSDVKCAIAMMNIIKYIADNNHALEEFPSLVDLAIKTGSKDLLPIRQASSAKYDSPSAINELLGCLSETVENVLLKEIRESHTYSIMLDEVTDVSCTKNLCIAIRYVQTDGTSKISFLSNSAMTRTTGLAVKEEVLKVLADRQIEKHLCSSITSDGASSFTGSSNGAATLLKAEMGHLIIFHCHDHRLALATSKAFEDVPKLRSLVEGLNGLYKYYEFSTVSAATLRELQDIFHQPHWRIPQAKHHRWLSYDKVTTTVLKGYSIILQDLENCAASEESTRSRKDDANGLVVWLTSELTVRSLCLLGDVLPALSELSLIFQKRQIDLGSIDPVLRRTLSKVRNLKHKPGYWERKLAKCEFPIRKQNSDEKSFEKEVKIPLINALTSHIEVRFENSSIISDLTSLALPIQDSEIFESLPAMYKENEINSLCNFFQCEKNAGDALMEWTDFCHFLKGIYIPQEPKWHSTLPFLSKLMMDKTSPVSVSLKDSYPILHFLYGVAITLSLSSAEVERIFSHLKLTKSDRRASLSNKTLNNLLNVKFNIDSNKWAEISATAAKTWLGLKERRLTFFKNS